MYLRSEDGLAQPERWFDPRWFQLPLPGSAKEPTEDELIDEQMKPGYTVGQITDKVFGILHPEFRGCSLPRSCQELVRLQREWTRLRAKVEGRQKKPPKP